MIEDEFDKTMKDIKEDFEERKQKKYYKITKKEMINLCLKVVKLMESVKNG